MRNFWADIFFDLDLLFEFSFRTPCYYVLMIEDSKFIHFIPFPQSVEYKWWSLVRSLCFELQKKLLMSFGSFKITAIRVVEFSNGGYKIRKIFA